MIAIDRKGREYRVGDIVQMCDFPVMWKGMIDRPLEIVEIISVDHCESGFNILVKDLETNKIFVRTNEEKRYMDTNWFQPIKDGVWNHFQNKLKQSA
jgi:hypothetical protein